VIGRLLLASVATGALVCGACAADLPVAPGASYYPAAMTPVPIYNWGGLYIGGNAGGAWASQGNVGTTDIPTGTATSTVTARSVGFAGGGQIGGNWFIAPSFVLGVEGDFDALTNKSSVISADGTNRHDNRLRFLSTMRGRFGLTADRFMLYLTGGFAWGENQITRTQLSGTVNNAGPGTVETLDRNRYGWTGGAGVEYAFAQNWTARAEYLYTQLDGISYTFPLAQRMSATGLGGISEVRAGVNFKFDWGGGALVTRD
jgi:outer membrane immunogenic protein